MIGFVNTYSYQRFVYVYAVLCNAAWMSSIFMSLVSINRESGRSKRRITRSRNKFEKRKRKSTPSSKRCARTRAERRPLLMSHRRRHRHRWPRTFQLMELIGYPKFDQENDEWYLGYVDQSIESAFEIVDSALLQIERTIKFAHFQSSDRPQNWASPPSLDSYALQGRLILLDHIRRMKAKI